MSNTTGSPPVRPLTLGLELEVVAFGSRSAIKAAINSLKWRKDNPLDVTAIGDWGDDNGVEKWTVWLVKTDASIATLNLYRGGIRAEGVELISSILKDDGVEAGGGWRIIVAAVLKAIHDGGIELFVSEDTKTGFHVHVGVGVGRKFTLEEVKKVCMLYLVYEFSIDRYHASHRCAEPQCQTNRNNCVFRDSTTPEALGIVIQCQTLEELMLVMCPSRLSADGTVVSASRQYKLNLLSLGLHGTLEWRQHDGTTDASIACGWADFVLHFVRSALNLSFDEIMEHERKKTPLSPTFVPDNLCPLIQIVTE